MFHEVASNRSVSARDGAGGGAELGIDGGAQGGDACDTDDGDECDHQGVFDE